MDPSQLGRSSEFTILGVELTKSDLTEARKSMALVRRVSSE